VRVLSALAAVFIVGALVGSWAQVTNLTGNPWQAWRHETRMLRFFSRVAGYDFWATCFEYAQFYDYYFVL
jgi:hypothetical protein